MKRIKIILTILIVFCFFMVEQTFALNCNDKSYMCYTCEYSIKDSKLEVRASSDGYGTIVINKTSDVVLPKTIGNYEINQTYYSMSPNLFKDGYSVKCPSSLYVCLSSMDYAGFGGEYMLNVSSQSCIAGLISYSASLSNSSTNGKPFFNKEQEEKVVGEDEEYSKTGYNVPIFLDDASTGKTFHIDSKEQVINNEITEVYIDGTKFKVNSSNNTVTNVTPYSSIKLMCKKNWASKKCWFIDSEKQERQEKERAYGATKDEYLDDMGDIFGNVEQVGSCDEIIGPDGIALIKKIFNWIRIITPIILLIMGAADFGKAVFASDDKQMTMAIKNFITRCIVALGIFFVPWIIYFFMDLIFRSMGWISEAGGICNFL